MPKTSIRITHNSRVNTPTDSWNILIYNNEIQYLNMFSRFCLHSFYKSPRKKFWWKNKGMQLAGSRKAIRLGSNPVHFQQEAHEIFRNIRRISGGGGGGLRENKHELCQIVLNKQQRVYTGCHYKCSVSITIDCTDHGCFGHPIRPVAISRSYLLLIVA